MSSLRSSTAFFTIMLWSAFGPMLQDSTNTTLTTAPFFYLEKDAALNIAPAAKPAIGPSSPLVSMLAAPEGYSTTDMLGYLYLHWTQDTTRNGTYAACIIALLALIVSSTTSTGRNILHSLISICERTSSVLFNGINVLKLAIEDRIPLTVGNCWTLIQEYHPYTANLVEGAKSCGTLNSISTSPFCCELASLLASVVLAATTLLVLRGWYMSEAFWQYICEYVSLYRRYESICELNQQSHSARDQALVDKAAQESLMLSKSRDALSEKRELVAGRWNLEVEKRSLEADKRNLEVELALARSALNESRKSNMEEVQELKKKLKVRQDLLAQIEHRKDTEKENLVKRVKTLQSRQASDTEVKCSERLSHQVSWLQDNIKNLKSKNFDLTAKNIKLRSTARFTPCGPNTPSVSHDLKQKINNDTVAMHATQREELEDAKKMIATLEQQLEINAAATKSSSIALAEAENVAVIAQAALRSQNAKLIQLEDDKLQHVDDQTRSSQRIEELEKHIMELTQTYDRSIEIIQSTEHFLTTELAEKHAQLMDSMNNIARLQMQRDDLKITESQAAAPGNDTDTVLVSEASQRSIDQLTELVVSHERAATKATEHIANLELEITTLKAASVELKQTNQDLGNKLQQMQLQPETLADHSKELSSEVVFWKHKAFDAALTITNLQSNIVSMENSGRAYFAQIEAEKVSITTHLRNITAHKCQLETSLRQSTDIEKQIKIDKLQMIERFNVMLQEKEAAERKLAIQLEVSQDKIQDLQETINIQETHCDSLTHEAHVWKNGLRDKMMEIDQLRKTNTLFKAQLYGGRGFMTDPLDQRSEGSIAGQHSETQASGIVERGRTAVQVGLIDENQRRNNSRNKKRRSVSFETEVEEEKNELSDLTNKKRKWTGK